MSNDIGAFIGQLASEAGEVEIAGSDSGTDYRRGGRLFAVANANGSAELCLRPDIADAARRTPDTGESTRGEEWVRFAPAELDDHARDRVRAWFLIAWRAAG